MKPIYATADVIAAGNAKIDFWGAEYDRLANEKSIAFRWFGIVGREAAVAQENVRRAFVLTGGAMRAEADKVAVERPDAQFLGLLQTASA